METQSRCLYNPGIRCIGSYIAHNQKEIIKCWQDNTFFLSDIEWYITGRGFDDVKVQCKRDYEFEALRKAKIWGYFGDEFDGMVNFLEVVEPWLQHGQITKRICQVMRKAEKKFIQVRIDEIIEMETK